MWPGLTFRIYRDAAALSGKVTSYEAAVWKSIVKNKCRLTVTVEKTVEKRCCTSRLHGC